MLGSKKCDLNSSNSLLYGGLFFTQVAEYEATTFSIFYNNSLFLALVIIASFYVLNGTSAHVNYLLSIGLSSGLIALLSTGTQS